MNRNDPTMEAWKPLEVKEDEPFSLPRQRMKTVKTGSAFLRVPRRHQNLNMNLKDQGIIVPKPRSPRNFVTTQQPALGVSVLPSIKHSPSKTTSPLMNIASPNSCFTPPRVNPPPGKRYDVDDDNDMFKPCPSPRRLDITDRMGRRPTPQKNAHDVYSLSPNYHKPKTSTLPSEKSPRKRSSRSPVLSRCRSRTPPGLDPCYFVPPHRGDDRSLASVSTRGSYLSHTMRDDVSRASRRSMASCARDDVSICSRRSVASFASSVSSSMLELDHHMDSVSLASSVYHPQPTLRRSGMTNPMSQYLHPSMEDDQEFVVRRRH